jgi:histidine triad (HIT) family protein
MADCIFCGIVSGDVPADKVAENADVIAFRDLSPVASTHVLVIPRRHIADASEIEHDDGALLGTLFATATEVARAEGVDRSGYRLVFNVGDDAGNTVPHLHLHVIGGRSLAWPPG